MSSTIAIRTGRSAHPDRLVALWLFACAGMILLMVVIGGVTRLTESGLSITQWKPLTGVVPSLGLAFIAKIFITVIVGGPAILLGTATAAAILGTAESVVAYLSTPIYGQVAMLGLALVVLRLFPDGLSGLWLRRA